LLLSEFKPENFGKLRLSIPNELFHSVTNGPSDQRLSNLSGPLMFFCPVSTRFYYPNLDADIAGLKSFQTMKKIFSQNFKDADPDGPELIEVATGKDHVSSPHQPEARLLPVHYYLVLLARDFETIGIGDTLVLALTDTAKWVSERSRCLQKLAIGF
jgi:hypothetical protein